MAPSFIKRPSNVTAVLHAAVELDCQASGKPAPTLKWVKYTNNGETVIHTGGRFVVITRLSDGSKYLSISGIQWSDAGRYGCVAQNQHGRAVAEAHVAVVTSMLEITFN